MLADSFSRIFSSLTKEWLIYRLELKIKNILIFDLELKASCSSMAVIMFPIDNFQFCVKFGLYMPCISISRIFSS